MPTGSRDLLSVIMILNDQFIEDLTFSYIFLPFVTMEILEF